MTKDAIKRADGSAGPAFESDATLLLTEQEVAENGNLNGYEL